jgi:hypothetical protein
MPRRIRSDGVVHTRRKIRVEEILAGAVRYLPLLEQVEAEPGTTHRDDAGEA